MKSSVPPYEDDDGYPSDAWLDAFRAHRFATIAEAASFLYHDLPEIAEHIPCMCVNVRDGIDLFDRPQKEIAFHTGGWSGAESLIDAMLDHLWIKHLHSTWQRGGHWYFEIPLSYLQQEEAA